MSGDGTGGGAWPGPHHGEVATFDEAVGLGTVRSSTGDTFGFHCTQIAGRSRTIEVGTAVTFTILAGRLGRWEAASVTPT